MKQHKTILIVAVLAFLLTVCLFGCGESGRDATPLSLAVVVGTHSNAGSIPLRAEAITAQLDQVAMTQGEITMIRADGDPAVVFQTTIPKLPVSGLSESKQESIAKGYVEQLQVSLGDIRAVNPELDTLEAIRMAGLALSKSEVRKVLLILDTGCSTKGYIQFTQGLLNSEPDAVVDALRDAKALPRLEGVTVLWALLGQTAAPQPDLSERDKQSLQQIWEAVLLAGGAERVEFLTDFAGEAYSGLPPVSVIETRDRTLKVEISMTVLSDAQVRFQGDSDNFIDLESAVRALEPAAAELKAHPDRCALLVGTTASGKDEAMCLELSLRRARAVKKLLVEQLGVPEDQLSCIGLGTQDPWHINDRDDTGQVEALAAQNRKVILLDADSDEAEGIRKVGGLIEE